MLGVVRTLYRLIASCDTEITPEDRLLADELVWEPRVKLVVWYRRANPRPRRPGPRRDMPPMRLELAVLMSPGSDLADAENLAARVRQIPHLVDVSIHELEDAGLEEAVVANKSVLELDVEANRYRPESE